MSSFRPINTNASKDLQSIQNPFEGLTAYQATWCGRVVAFMNNKENKNFLPYLRRIPVISTLVVPIFMKIMATYQNYIDNISADKIRNWKGPKGENFDERYISWWVHIQGTTKESYAVQQRINFVSLIPIIGNIAAACLDYKRSSELENR